ncbi:MAG TPA: glycosyltransferase family 4 protein [Polyangiaceae bacterium]|jgi:glycosyltransferase involved in cell wall biosynthesis
MSARPIAYVMEQTLGSITHYLNLRREESAAEGPRPRWMPIEFQTGFLPWTVTASWLTRRALRGVLDEVDGIFMHTTTLAPLSVDYFRKKPTVLSSDGTPLNKRGMRHAYGLREEGRLSQEAKRTLYRGVFGSAAGLVAWSNWTKQSFVNDYGCREEDVAVIPPGIDLKEFSVGDRNHELPRILFVGGDFERKGGDLLLDVFRRRLRGRSELILVTKAQIPDEPGVSVHRNVSANSDELHDLYRTSDLFVLPTRADCYSLVCMEALAAGLPIVATRVGGIPDMIQEGQTGHLLEVGDAGALGDALEALVMNPAQRQIMSKNSRREAERRFDARENARALFEFVRSRC